MGCRVIYSVILPSEATLRLSLPATAIELGQFIVFYRRFSKLNYTHMYIRQTGIRGYAWYVYTYLSIARPQDCLRAIYIL